MANRKPFYWRVYSVEDFVLLANTILEIKGVDTFTHNLAAIISGACRHEPDEICTYVEKMMPIGGGDHFAREMSKFYKILYDISFEDLPLYISSPNKMVATVANWRLQIGK